MNTTAFRRIGAIVGAAAFVTTFAISGTSVSASTGKQVPDKDRPCFMVRSHWNNAEGPQPTCPRGRFTGLRPTRRGASRPASSGRVMDVLP